MNNVLPVAYSIAAIVVYRAKGTSLFDCLFINYTFFMKFAIGFYHQCIQYSHNLRPLQ